MRLKRGLVEATATIYARGRVQGVGFRPFVYRTATNLGLTGYVTNLKDGTVKIVVEGDREEVKRFLEELKTRSPPMSEIDKVTLTWEPYKGLYKKFRIRRSEHKAVATLSFFPPPDIGICDECAGDVLQPSSRWYHYPFTCCSFCGPRFTAIYALPYDRCRTNMAEFPLCRRCKGEYNDPSNRRFHAQGTCCPLCGPQMALYTADGRRIEADDPFRVVGELIDEGFIVAIKGIGGIHLAAKTTEDGPIAKLRQRKRRKYQPFAIMSPDISVVKGYAVVTRREEGLLTSWRRPIVILQKSPDYYLSDLISPGLDTVGVMLPYTGIHLLLFQHTKEPALIMTSANEPHMPMVTTNREALRRLNGIADYLLLHNRKIAMRCDDSVLRVVDDRVTFIRRSRGFVLSTIDVPIRTRSLCVAFGAELRQSAAVLCDGKCCMTQFIGDVENIETLNYLQEATGHLLRRMLGITRDPDVISCDLHPRYITSWFAERLSSSKGIELVKVQHHFAHIASLMAEKMVGVGESIVGIVCDGVGYGPDGTIWGGEVLLASYDSYERLGHLALQPMPGGDLCTYYPLRMLIAILAPHLSLEEIRDVTLSYVRQGLPHGERELAIVYKQARKRDTLKTSSTGRVLDAASALFGICRKYTYEGEAAMRLEAVASAGRPRYRLGVEIVERNGKFIFNTSKLFLNSFNLLKKTKKIKKEDLAASFQHSLAMGLAEMAVLASEKAGVNTVGVSGGVFVNRYITSTIHRYLKGRGIRFSAHEIVPPGDGGIALGQSVIAVMSHSGA